MSECKAIYGTSGHYDIYDDGKVYGNQRKKFLSYQYDRHDHKCVRIRYNEGWRRRRVSVLVAEAFIENPDKLPVVIHIDGDKDNCRVENLRWGVHKELPHLKNRRDRVVKLTGGDIFVIQKRLWRGERPIDIAKDYDVGYDEIEKLQ